MENNLNETEIQITQDSPVDISLHNESEQNIAITQEASVIRGVDGFSPVAKVTQESDGARITITDLNGITTAFARNGERGEKGERGERGVQGVQGERGEQGIQGERGEQGIQGERGEQGIQGIQGVQGERGEQGIQGIQGPAGADGYSPTATVTKTGNTATITITDKNGTTTTSVTEPTKTSDLTNDSGFITGMVEMSYGESNAWAKFLSAYQAKQIVYCRASSNSNPASGSQTRRAFMAYVNNTDNPTQVEFQYYRSVSSHTDSQQGDQVFVYLLTNANGGTWTVTTRNAFTKVVAGTNMTSSYSNGAITLNADSQTTPTSIIGSISGYSSAVTLESSSVAYTIGNLAILNLAMTVNTAFSAQWGYLLKGIPAYTGSGVQYVCLLSATSGTVYRGFITNGGLLQVREAIPTGLYNVNITYVYGV